MIVVDNSVLVSAIVRTGGSQAALSIVGRDQKWILPPLWKFEFTNAIATMAKAGAIDMDAARLSLYEARTLVAGREVPVDQEQSLRFAMALKISGYDAQYIALADAYGLMCVTDDRQLVRRASNRAILLDDFVK